MLQEVFKRVLVRWLASLLIMATLAVIILGLFVFMRPVPEVDGLASSEMALLVATIFLLCACGGVAMTEDSHGMLLFGGAGIGIGALLLVFFGPLALALILVLGVIGAVVSFFGDIFGG